MVLADTRPQADTPQAREGRVQLRELLAREGPRGVADQMLPKLLVRGGAAATSWRATRALIEGGRRRRPSTRRSAR